MTLPIESRDIDASSFEMLSSAVQVISQERRPTKLIAVYIRVEMRGHRRS